MSLRSRFQSRRLVAAGLLCVGLAACAGQPDEQESADVTHSIGVATYGLQAYFQSGSAGAQQVTLESAALGAQPIDQAALEGGFPFGAVRARVHVLELVNAYETKLAALADSNGAIEDLETAKTLDPAVAGLPAELAALHDPTSARYAAPVSAVLAWVGESFTDTQRSQAMQEALQTAAPAANQVLDLLAADIKAIQDQRQTGSADLMERQRSYYNSNLRRLSLADRVALVEAMHDSGAAHQQGDSTAAAGLIDALKKMHAALVAYVSSSRSDADQHTVGAAMTQFEQTVSPLTAALVGR